MVSIAGVTLDVTVEPTPPGLPVATEGPQLFLLDDTVERPPAIIQAIIANADPFEVFVLAVDGVDQLTVTTDVDGNLDATSISLDETYEAGMHEITATSDTHDLVFYFGVTRSGAIQPTSNPADSAPQIVPEAQVGTRYRWVLQDLAPGGLGSWVMPANPVSMSPPHRRKTVNVRHTTSPNQGQFRITEGHAPPMDWQFAGYCPDQAFYDQLVAYANLKRRFYIIDHRNRAWVVVITGLDVKPRKRQRRDDGAFNDWAHDYTVNTLILDPDWRTPA